MGKQKTFKTIEEQISLLKARGLIISDEAYAANYLLSNNYYNIINGYSKYFISKGDTYLPGANFDEVICLYSFDREIKQAFFNKILSVEGHLKSIFAYHFAKKYRNTPYAYLDTAYYDSSKTLSVVTTIYHLSGIINHYKKQPNSSIAHYLKNYGSVPIWVLINYMDFGELRHMISSVSTQLQNSIAHDMETFIQQNLQKSEIFPPETMLSFIENINDVRNICAHNNRLIDFKCRRDCKYWFPLHSSAGLTANDYRNTIYSVYLSMQCFLNSGEFNVLHNSLDFLMQTLNKNLKTISANTIIQTLGFPKDWFTPSSL